MFPNPCKLKLASFSVLFSQRSFFLLWLLPSHVALFWPSLICASAASSPGLGVFSSAGRLRPVGAASWCSAGRHGASLQQRSSLSTRGLSVCRPLGLTCLSLCFSDLLDQTINRFTKTHSFLLFICLLSFLPVFLEAFQVFNLFKGPAFSFIVFSSSFCVPYNFLLKVI